MRRHTFAVLSITYGMDIYTLSKMLGHVKVVTTEIYARLGDEKKRDIISATKRDLRLRIILMRKNALLIRVTSNYARLRYYQ